MTNPHIPPTDDTIRDMLSKARVIAVVGFSAKPDRPSHSVATFLQSKGYRVLPVNPGLAGQEFMGETVVASLADLTEPVDMVDIFRRSQDVGPIVDQALTSLPGLQTVWMQIGVQHPEAALRAQVRGVGVVQDRCTKIEYQRLIAEGPVTG